MNLSGHNFLYLLLWLSTGLGTVSVLASVGMVLRFWTLVIIAIIVSYLFRARLTDKIYNIPFVTAIAVYCFAVFISGFNAEDQVLWLKRSLGTATLGLLAILLAQIRTDTLTILAAKWIPFFGAAFAVLAMLEVYFSISLPDVYLALHQFDIDSNTGEKVIGSYGLVPRARGYFVEPNEFSQYLLLPLGVALGLGLVHSNHKGRFLSIASRNSILVTLIAAQILSLSRGGFLGFFAQIILYWYVRGQLKTKDKHFLITNKSYYFSVLTLLSAPLIYIAYTHGNEAIYLNDILNATFERYLLTNFGADPTTNIRLADSNLGLDVWLETIGTFFIGCGAGNLYLTSVGNPTTSNFLIDILAETGIIGLLSFLSILAIIVLNFMISFIWSAKHRNNDPTFAPASGFLLAAIGLIFGGQTYATHNMFFTWIAFGLVAAATNRERSFMPLKLPAQNEKK